MLLRRYEQFRPATRQELNHSNSRHHVTAAAGTPVTGKFGAGTPDGFRYLEVVHQPKTLRGRRKPKRRAGSHGGYAEGPSLLLYDPKGGGDDLCGRNGSRLPAVVAATYPCSNRESKVVAEKGGTLAAGEEGGFHGERRKSTQDPPAAQQRCTSVLVTGRNNDNNNADDGDDEDDNTHTLATGYSVISPCCSPTNTTHFHVARCTCELCRRERARRVPGPPARPTFKFVGAEPKLVSATLQAQRFTRHTGARAARGGARAAWRLLWSSQHLRCVIDKLL